MKAKTGFILGSITAIAAGVAGAVALKRTKGIDVVEEVNSRIPSPLFPKRTEEKKPTDTSDSPASAHDSKKK